MPIFRCRVCVVTGDGHNWRLSFASSLSYVLLAFWHRKRALCQNGTHQMVLVVGFRQPSIYYVNHFERFCTSSLWARSTNFSAVASHIKLNMKHNTAQHTRRFYVTRLILRKLVAHSFALPAICVIIMIVIHFLVFFSSILMMRAREQCKHSNITICMFPLLNKSICCSSLCFAHFIILILIHILCK